MRQQQSALRARGDRWEAWAAPKTSDGKFDHNTAMTGDDLRDFVNAKLRPLIRAMIKVLDPKIGERTRTRTSGAMRGPTN